MDEVLLVFLENITSCACLDRSGLKIIFDLYAQSEIFSDLYLIDQLTYWDHRQLKTVRDVSSPKSLS